MHVNMLTFIFHCKYLGKKNLDIPVAVSYIFRHFISGHSIRYQQDYIISNCVWVRTKRIETRYIMRGYQNRKK